MDKSRLFTLPTSYQRNFTLYWGEAYQIIECLFYSYINYYYIYIKFIISFAFTWKKVVYNIFFIISGFMRLILKQEVRIKWSLHEIILCTFWNRKANINYLQNFISFNLKFMHRKGWIRKKQFQVFALDFNFPQKDLNKVMWFLQGFYHVFEIPLEISLDICIKKILVR